MRIHLGHHFYGAGNLGDDFMLAGFLAALRTLAPTATFTCCVPFALDPLRRRVPAITWLPCDEPTRARCITECAAWLGLGGSPFQSALSRWFVDHLVSEAALCARAHKPMYFLGVGVQTSAELADPDVQRICAQAAAIWTRDAASADVALLTTDLPTGPYPYAGVPWFSTPFGRDGIITAWQMLWLDPSLAKGVLTYLAKRQATEVSAFQDSAPGKIMPETRGGEMSALGEVPFGIYYGGVDTTCLFIALAGAYAKRTGDLETIRAMMEALTKALIEIWDRLELELLERQAA